MHFEALMDEASKAIIPFALEIVIGHVPWMVNEDKIVGAFDQRCTVGQRRQRIGRETKKEGRQDTSNQKKTPRF